MDRVTFKFGCIVSRIFFGEEDFGCFTLRPHVVPVVLPVLKLNPVNKAQQWYVDWGIRVFLLDLFALTTNYSARTPIVAFIAVFIVAETIVIVRSKVLFQTLAQLKDN